MREMNLSTPQIQARIEALPVENWKPELAKIQDKATRERIRNHLKTVFALRKNGSIK